MDVISYSKASAQEVRIKKIIAEPDSTSGLVTMPSVIASGETTTIPAGRVVVHPNLQVDGTLDVQGSLFVPAGGSVSEATVNTGALVVDISAILPSNTAIGNVSAAELGYIDGVTSNIQAQLDSKQRMQLMTAQNSTSGTAIDFTGIPNWAKKITIMFNGVSTSGTSYVRVQLGSSTIQTTGYLGTVTKSSTSAVASANFTTGFDGYDSLSAGDLRNGSLGVTNLSSNTWCISGSYGLSNSVGSCCISGSVILSGTLDRLRITTVNGTDTFDAGQINVLYEG